MTAPVTEPAPERSPHLATITGILPQLTDREFLELRGGLIPEEARRRETAPAVAETMQEVFKEHPELDPAAPDKTTGKRREWRQPLGAHDAYKPGAVIKHNGKLWVNVLDVMNVWQPGVHGWAETTEDAQADNPVANEPEPEAVPFKPGMELKAGDIVTYNGADYKVIQPHTSAAHWPPDAAHSLFSRL